jgi:hypothetical protein
MDCTAPAAAAAAAAAAAVAVLLLLLLLLLCLWQIGPRCCCHFSLHPGVASP